MRGGYSAVIPSDSEGSGYRQAPSCGPEMGRAGSSPAPTTILKEGGPYLLSRFSISAARFSASFCASAAGDFSQLASVAFAYSTQLPIWAA